MLMKVKVSDLFNAVITEELLNFARSKPTKVNENVEDGKRKNLQSLIDKLNEFRYFWKR